MEGCSDNYRDDWRMEKYMIFYFYFMNLKKSAIQMNLIAPQIFEASAGPYRKFFLPLMMIG